KRSAQISCKIEYFAPRVGASGPAVFPCRPCSSFLRGATALWAILPHVGLAPTTPAMPLALTVVVRVWLVKRDGARLVMSEPCARCLAPGDPHPPMLAGTRNLGPSALPSPRHLKSRASAAMRPGPAIGATAIAASGP